MSFLYSFSLELLVKPTIKTMDEIMIKASIDGLRPISLAVKANKKLTNINCEINCSQG